MTPVNLIEATKVYCRLFFDQSCRCLFCGQTQSHQVCPSCLVLLARLDGPLCRCGLHHPAGSPDGVIPAPLCGRCLRQPPPFTASQAPLHYSFPLDRLIGRYKYRGDLVAERGIEQLLADTPCPWPDMDALCPLPAHWRRRWQRGFDQSQRLTDRLAGLWKMPSLPALQRQQSTPMQQGLSRSQRRRNLRGAFACARPVSGLKLVLVDDVMTTGSSARAASECLLRHGAAEVRVWTLARTPER